MATNPPTIAAAMRRGRRSVVEHLTSVRATNADSAVTYQPQDHSLRKGLSYLMAQGVVQLTEDGRYWLDQGAAEEWRRNSRAQAALIAGGAVAALGVALWLRRSRKNRD
ncbi:hypothetical protein [Sphingosinicella sp. YJ22]|uniref:hypothetical protein n=1 Tax=Sphingosinicella sp. YJ22 TaxID=1104780 RepID=UPI00140C6358|nr:hypothetical protein [Sphingosinicella sp. YJ22]